MHRPTSMRVRYRPTRTLYMWDTTTHKQDTQQEIETQQVIYIRLSTTYINNPRLTTTI